MKRILIILLTINCSLFTIYCSAKLQGQARTDSLLKELPRAKEDTNKVRLLQQLAIQYAGTDPEKGMIYIKQGTELASQLGDKLGMAVENNLAGNYYFRKSDYPNALAYYFKAQALFDEIGTHDNAMYGNIGSIYRNLGDYEKALEYLFKALKASEKKGSKGGIAATTCNIGVVYKSQQNYTKALDYLFKALKLDEEEGYKEFASTVCSNIGNIYQTLKDYPMALEYHRRSLQIAEEIDYKFMIAKSIAAVGSLYLTIVDDTAANGGNVTVSPERPVGWYKPTARIPKDRATLVAKAIDHYLLALVEAKELGALNQITICYRGLSRAYKLKGDYKNAMEYGDSARVAEDSIYSNENDEKITMLENSRKEFADSLKAAVAQKAADAKLAQRRNYEVIGGSAFVMLLGFTFLLTKKNKLLDKEKKENENLLHNILPEEVATELKATGTTIAKHYDNVTVLFTDFVSFTQAAEQMNAQGLIDELHNCFKAFDEITHRYNIEKIKTIGDAYLAVCGLPTADPNHAANVVKAAIEINAFMQDRMAKIGSERTFTVRIGIHSGSVVAGIVGVKKFAYDIWGDTVNTAARMEQNSEAGKINISESTYELVKDKFSCEYRGEVLVKGKGDMKMYFVG